MCLPQSPMIFNGINDVIGISGGMETLAIHWCKWLCMCAIGFIAANGVNGTIGNIGSWWSISANGDLLASPTSIGIIDVNVQWGMCSIGDPFVQTVISMCTIGFIAANGVNGAIGKIGCWWSMTPVASLISMCNGACVALAIHWCKWLYPCVPLVSLLPMVSMAPLGTLDVGDPLMQMAIFWRLWIQWSHWNVWNVAHRHSMVPLVSMELFSPLTPLKPLSPLALLSTLPPLYDQFIIIISNVL